MAPGSPELRLNVSFDIDHFKRVALQGLIDAASKTTLDIGVQFKREDITKEMIALGRQLGTRKYRVDFEIRNIQTALAHVDTLSRKLDELRTKTSNIQTGAGSSAASGGGNIGSTKLKLLAPEEIKGLYRAAAEAGLVAFNESIANNKEKIAQQMGQVAKDSIQGLVNGLLSGSKEAGAAAAAMGEETLRGIKKKLGIASPSKEMEKIGEWAGKGYELGFIKSLEEANAEAAIVIGKSLRKIDNEVAVRQRAARLFAPGEQNKRGQIPFVSLQERLGVSLGRRERLQTAAQIPQLRAAAGTYTEGSLQNINKLLQSAQLLAAELAPDTEKWNRAQSEIARLNHELRRSGELANKIQMQHDLAAFSPGSLAHLESKLQLLKNIARDIAPDDSKWKEINQKIQQTERLIEKTTRKPLTQGQRLGAAGGAFLYGGGMGGGVGSALGGVAGGLMGGVPGAFTGAAIGQFADNMAQATSAMATAYSQLQKMQRGLAMASIDAKDFAAAQDLVTEISQRQLVTLTDVTRYYSQLRVNTKQYNISAKETGQILEGTIAAIRATGGSLEDIDGAMRAVVQIFSKGGVQAEELRGQLGERFPGAVVKFAQANKLTFEELQKRLEDGSVGIAEFVTFAKSNFTDYAKFSQKLATAPEYAGDRLKIAMEKLQRTIGPTLAFIGAKFQDLFTRIVDGAQIVAKWLAKVFNMKGREQINEELADATKKVAELQKWKQAAGDSAAGRMYDAQLKIKQKELDALKKEQEQVDKSLTYGGKGANMPTTRLGKDGDKKGVEGFEKLRDDLAKAYNDAEIARIKQRYELQKQLQQDQFDMQEFGANRLQKQNLALIKGLINAEVTRVETVQNAQLEIRKQSGKVAGGAGGGIAGLTQYITGDPSQKGYQADHGTIKNYHDHLAFATRKAAEDAYKRLVEEGIKVTEFKGYGKGVTGPHSGPGSLHHQGLAFDVPGYQWGGTGAIGAKEFAGSARVRQALGIGGQVGAGSLRKVKGDEKRGIMAEATTAIATQNAQQAALDANITKSSNAMKEFARYAAEAYNVPELKLSNDLLKLRNDLTQQGISPEAIDYQLRVYEIEQQRQHLLSIFPQYADQMKLSEEQRKRGLEALSKALNGTTIEEKRKNDETLRGALIAVEREQANRLEMAKALTPQAEMRVRIKQANAGQSQGTLDSLFQTEQAIVKAEELKTQMQGVASTIGDAFSTAFQGIINGSVSAQEALGNMFKSIGESFVKMAMDMIAKQLVMITLGFIMKALGLAGSAAGGGLSDLNAPQSINNPLGIPAAANGAIFSNGIAKFATGGIVNGPTLFPFANGGAMQMGLMGEAGPEAIMPLQRGPDGALGVRAAMGGNSMGGSGSPILNMNFETSTINGVEYVSRDQLEAAMAQTRRQASSDGAKRGMAMTLDKIQQSPQTRRRIGM